MIFLYRVSCVIEEPTHPTDLKHFPKLTFFGSNNDTVILERRT